MDLYTGMAVDAFRKQAHLQRRLNKADRETSEAIGRMPSRELHLYTLHTEIIRFELDREEAKRLHMPEEVEANESMIVKYREAIRVEEEKLASAAAETP